MSLEFASLINKYFILIVVKVRPICIPTEEPIRSKSFTGYMPFVAGWGRTQEGGKSANVLQELQIPVLDNEVCKDRYRKQKKLISEKQFTKNVLCAGVLTGGQDSCQGKNIIFIARLLFLATKLYWLTCYI